MISSAICVAVLGAVRGEVGDLPPLHVDGQGDAGHEAQVEGVLDELGGDDHGDTEGVVGVELDRAGVDMGDELDTVDAPRGVPVSEG
jgi:hypothetical protein